MREHTGYVVKNSANGMHIGTFGAMLLNTRHAWKFDNKADAQEIADRRNAEHNTETWGVQGHQWFA